MGQVGNGPPLLDRPAYELARYPSIMLADLDPREDENVARADADPPQACDGMRASRSGTDRRLQSSPMLLVSR